MSSQEVLQQEIINEITSRQGARARSVLYETALKDPSDRIALYYLDLLEVLVDAAKSPKTFLKNPSNFNAYQHGLTIFKSFSHNLSNPETPQRLPAETLGFIERGK
jgi:hypothetical protein